MNKRICLPLALLFAVAGQPMAFADQSPQPHSQVIQAPCDSTFQKVIDALVDNNCVILAANQMAGLISFRTQSESYPNSARRHVNILDGTILLRAESPASTRIRVQLTLNWQESNDTAGTFKTGAQKEADAGWYKIVFDILGLPVSPSTK